MADENGNYDGSNVDLMVEIADAREAQRSYEANLKMFDQVRQMSSSRSTSSARGSRMTDLRAQRTPPQPTTPPLARRPVHRQAKAGGPGDAGGPERLRPHGADGRGHGRPGDDRKGRSARLVTGAGPDRTGRRDRRHRARQGGRGLPGNPANAGLRWASWTLFYDTMRQGLWIAVVISPRSWSCALVGRPRGRPVPGADLDPGDDPDLRAQARRHRRDLLAVDGLHDGRGGRISGATGSSP